MESYRNPESDKYLKIESLGDIGKLHAEIQQARNQQFTLGTLALTVFGLSSWLLPRAVHGPDQSAINAYATIALLSIFCLMLRWSKTLGILITIVSKYLEIRGLSEWEKDFREFSQTNKKPLYRSQSKAVASMYLLLGILTYTGFFINLAFTGTKFFSGWSIAVALVFIAYMLYGTKLVFGKRLENTIEDRWRDVLSKRIQRDEVTSP